MRTTQWMKRNVQAGLKKLRLDKQFASILLNTFLQKCAAHDRLWNFQDRRPRSHSSARHVHRSDFEGINHDSLEFDLSEQSLKLTDLRLRRETSFELGLPVDVKIGIVKTFEVSKPAPNELSITLDGVYLVAGSLAESDWDEPAQRNWACACSLSVRHDGS